MNLKGLRARGGSLGTITAALIVAAGLGYALLIVVARLLDAHTNAQFLSLWGLLFGLGAAMMVVEQETARQTTHAALEGRAVGRGVAQVAALSLALTLAVLGGLLATPLSDLLLRGGGAMLAVVVAGVVGLAGLLVCRGVLIAHDRVRAYGGLITAEAGVRVVAIAAIALVAADRRLIPAVAAVALGWWVWVPVLGRVRGLVDLRAASEPFGPVARRTLLLALAAGLTACLMTGFPALVTATTGSDERLAALFLAVSMSRIPLLLVIPVQSLTVPAVVRAVAAGGAARLRRAVGLAAAASVVIAALAAAVSWLIGPWALSVMFAGYHAERWVMAALSASAVAVGVAQLCTAALIALGRFSWTTLAWGVGVVTVLGVLLSGAWQPDTRGAIALTAGSLLVGAVSTVLVLAGLAHPGARVDDPEADGEAGSAPPPW